MDSKIWERSGSLVFIKWKPEDTDSSLSSLQKFKIINVIGEQTQVKMSFNYHNHIGSNIFAFI